MFGHTGLTDDLAYSVKLIQKRALLIIFGGNSFTISSYHSFCDSLAISSLYDRMDKLSTDISTKFFTRQAVSNVHYLLPNERHNSQINILRNHSLCPLPFTQKYTNSFMVNSLRHYQQNL